MNFTMASDSGIDESIRLQYLQMMGIDVWIPRHGQVDMPAAEFDDEKPSEEKQTASIIPDRRDYWTDLSNEVAVCQNCQLCKTRTQTVFGNGNQQADWMFIGEAPGKSEDQEGKPFVGKAGQLLTEMIRALGLDREQVFIANILKCRPPGNRDPKAEEVAACSGFLQRQIALVQPKIILAVGRVAAQNLLKTQEPLAKLRGIVHKLDNIPLIVIYHPAYLLRSLLEKRKAWDDLQFALRMYEELKE